MTPQEYGRAHYELNKEKYISKSVAWNRANKERRLSIKLKHLYGITKADYDQMLAVQGGRCAICNEPPAKGRLHVDHDHVTGAVRKLLCKPCNGMIGYAKDSPDILRRGAEYIEKHP